MSWRAGARARPGFDPADEVALVASAKRELLLRVHRHRLRREDLEDCYSQAALELIAYARNGAKISSRSHLANIIEQRFLSRVHDRRRALSGRSPMHAALEAAASFDGVTGERIDVVDLRAELEALVIHREDLRRVGALARQLSPDQRLVLSAQLGADEGGASEFCRIHGWTPEKYRKVAQRARARLKQLMASDESVVPFARRPSEEETGTTYEAISPHS
ncbi:MAG TPA: hypothetical protein VK790_10450 [Solirubrobacteraceae bacterium]|nr:hypothetical protein [Solirubrobacteraceae bacterium]